MKVSVIIPAYNAQRYLRQCLESLSAQSRRAQEIIVVDDASGDATARIAAQCGITCLRLKRRSGAGAARNAGAERAQGDILVFTDSDCVAPPAWLENIVRAYEERKEETAAVAGGYAGDAGSSFMGKFAALELSFRRRDFPAYVQTAVSNNLSCRSAFREAGGFPRYFTGASAEDLIFTYRLSRRVRIRWLGNNGVLHHFPRTLTGYLRQQYVFARDMLVTYARHPAIFRVRTHHGRGAFMQLLLGCSLIASLGVSGRLSLTVLALTALINMPFLVFLKKKESSAFALQGYAVCVVRNLSWAAGLAGGIVTLVATRVKVNKSLWRKKCPR